MPSSRIETIRVGEIMIPLNEYPSVRPDATLREAVELLEHAELEVAGRKSRPRMLLVIDETGRLGGSVRRRDLMRGLEPSFLVTEPLYYRKKLFDVKIDPNLSELSYDHIVKGIKEQSSRPVTDVMRPIQVAIEHDEHVIKAVYEMVSYGITLLPVLKDNRVVGVVRSVELFHEMAHIVLA